MVRFGLAIAALAALLGGCERQREAETESSPVESALAELERQQPVFALMREHEPAAYQELREAIERAVRERIADRDELSRRGRDIFARLIETRVRTAPDDVVIRLMKLVADQTTHLESNPSVCVGVLDGTAGDVRPHLPADMQRGELDLYADLLRAPKQAEARVATQPQAIAAIRPIMESAAADLGMTETQLEAAFAGAAPAGDVCRANAYLFRRLTELPAEESAPVFRFMGKLAADDRGGPAPAR